MNSYIMNVVLVQKKKKIKKKKEEMMQERSKNRQTVSFPSRKISKI